MTNDDYVIRLQNELEAQSYPSNIIQKCCTYAESLLSEGLPVLFDANHVYRVLQLQKVDLNSYHISPKLCLTIFGVG